MARLPVARIIGALVFGSANSRSVSSKRDLSGINLIVIDHFTQQFAGFEEVAGGFKIDR